MARSRDLDGNYIEVVTIDELNEAGGATTIIENIVNNETFVTEVTEVLVQNDTFVTELVTNTTIVEQTVNEITNVEENNEYITQITENNTFVTNVTNLTTTVVNGKKGQANELATLAADSQLTHSQVPAELLTGALAAVIDGGGSAISAGTKAFLPVPYACTVTGWRILGTPSGSISVDVKRSTYSGFPTTSSIAGTEKPALSSAQKNEDTNLTTWGDVTLDAGDILEIVAEATPATVTLVSVILLVTRTI